MKEFWNERYDREGMAYGQEPNEFFREQLNRLTPGKILLPAEGEGRNAVYAAQQGWEVLAFDFSAAGREKALKLAAQSGVSIDFQVADAAEYTCPAESLDAVALIYAHFPSAVRKQFHPRVAQWLKPGGTLILEAFHPNQLQQHYPSGGPKDVSMLYTADLLEQEFQGLKITLREEREITLAEGTYHEGKGFVTRLVATKPETLQ
ncbi:class I SAM-dependent methyltransferase [Pontibacter sp. CAU 1760]